MTKLTVMIASQPIGLVKHWKGLIPSGLKILKNDLLTTRKMKIINYIKSWFTKKNVEIDFTYEPNLANEANIINGVVNEIFNIQTEKKNRFDAAKMELAGMGYRVKNGRDDIFCDLEITVNLPTHTIANLKKSTFKFGIDINFNEFNNGITTYDLFAWPRGYKSYCDSLADSAKTLDEVSEHIKKFMIEQNL